MIFCVRVLVYDVRGNIVWGFGAVIEEKKPLIARGAPRSRSGEGTLMKDLTRRELLGRLVPGATMGFLAALAFLARDTQADGQGKKKVKAKRKAKGRDD